jgi:hypothetical protein
MYYTVYIVKRNNRFLFIGEFGLVKESGVDEKMGLSGFACDCRKSQRPTIFQITP